MLAYRFGGTDEFWSLTSSLLTGNVSANDLGVVNEKVEMIIMLWEDDSATIVCYSPCDTVVV